MSASLKLCSYRHGLDAHRRHYPLARQCVAWGDDRTGRRAVDCSVAAGGAVGEAAGGTELVATGALRWALASWFALAAIALLWFGPAYAQNKSTAAKACPAVLDHVMPRLQDEAPQNLCQFAGRVVLVVNTASYCGFTGQYEQLEQLHSRYAARGLTVMGFPSNDFGQQEPGTKEQIAELCFNTYGVKFPMFSKVTVVGKDAHPLYARLTKASGQSPRWNFHKYLIDRNGNVVASVPSQTSPLDAKLTQQIETLLAAPVSAPLSAPAAPGHKGS